MSVPVSINASMLAGCDVALASARVHCALCKRWLEGMAPATHPPTLPPATPADVRVIKSVAAGRGGRVRDEKEAAAAKTITVTSDGREQAAAAATQAAAPAAPAAPAAAPTGGEAPANVAEARAWIAAWKAKQGSATAAADAGAADGASQGGAEVPPNVAEAREWIRRWRASNLEKQLPQGAVSK